LKPNFLSVMARRRFYNWAFARGAFMARVISRGDAENAERKHSVPADILAAWKAALPVRA